MQFLKIQFEAFKNKLKSPLFIGKKTIESREGLFLKLENRGLGEVAPLPGIHQESLPTVLEWLHENYLIFTRLIFCPENFNTEAPYLGLLDPESTLTLNAIPFPSLRFGLEQALWSLYHYDNHYDKNNNNEITFYRNALCTTHDLTPDNIDKTVDFLQEQSYSTVKVKIGFYDLKTELDWLHQLVQKFHFAFPLHPSLRLRLDPNDRLKLKIDKMIPFVSSMFKNLPLDYIEDIDDATLSDFPVALDALLWQLLSPTGELTSTLPRHIKAIIIKPTRIGLVSSLRLIHHAKKQGIGVTLSNTIDSCHTLSTLVSIAAFTDILMTPHGLDTDRLLESDPTRWNISGPWGRPTLTYPTLQKNIFTKEVDRVHWKY